MQVLSGRNFEVSGVARAWINSLGVGAVMVVWQIMFVCVLESVFADCLRVVTKQVLAIG